MSRYQSEAFKRQFRVALSEDEKAGARERLVNVMDELNEMQDKEAGRRAEEAKKIKAKSGQIDALRMDVRIGELRDVSCERKYDWVMGEVTEIRIDTGEVIVTRKVTDKDRQLYLPDDLEGGTKS